MEAARSVSRLYGRVYPQFRLGSFHHDYAAQLDRFIQGKIRVLVINMPPGHVKSWFASQLAPAMYMGLHPEGQFIGGSYNTELAKKFGREVRNIVAGADFRSVFPEVWLRRDSKAAGRWNTNQGGSYVSAAVEKSVTGFRADRVNIDDPHENFAAGNDVRVTEKAWQWFGDLYTRRMPGACIGLVMQRMSNHDMTARLLKLCAEKGETPIQINFPAIRDPKTGAAIRYDGTRAGLEKLKQGAALWPEFHTLADMVDQAHTLGSARFNAEYQQIPDETAGQIIQPHQILYWSRPGEVVEGRTQLPRRFDYLAQSWDMRFKEGKSGSYVVGQVWGFWGDYKALLDQARGQWGFTDSVKAVEALSSRWPLASTRWIEDKANGPAIENQLKKRFRMRLVKPSGSKTARMQACQVDFENGTVLLPPPEEDQYEWVPGMRQRLLTFPAEPNDEGDALSQALNQHRVKSAFGRSL